MAPEDGHWVWRTGHCVATGESGQMVAITGHLVGFCGQVVAKVGHSV